MQDMKHDIPASSCWPVLLLATALLGGCITGDEAGESMEPDPGKELTDLEMDHDIGVVSDVEYESRRERLLGED